MEILERYPLLARIISAMAFLASSFGLALFFVFIMPWLLPMFWLQVFFVITLSTANVIGFFTSWYYFNKTKCYSSEGNVGAFVLYKIIGGDLTHVGIGFVRLVLNLAFVYVILFIGITNAWILWFVASTTSTFVIESIFNIFAISTKIDDVCNEKSLLFADIKGKILYCIENRDDPQCELFLNDDF